MAGDFAPWTLLLPAAALFHFRELRAGRGGQGAAGAAPREPGRLPEPLRRFFALAVLVPVLLLSLSQSKQGKYVLMVYPFLALLLAEALRRAGGGGPPFASRRARAFVGWLFAGLFGLAGGAGLQAQIAPYLGPTALIAAAFLFGACLFARGAAQGSMRLFARDVGVTVGLASLAAGTWGFRLLEPRKGYGAWTEAVGPHIAGRQVNFWQTVRSGAMVHTDSLTMPELRAAAQLEALPPGALLVAIERDWPTGQGGLTEAHRAMFETLVETPVGGGGFMLLRKKAQGPGWPQPARAGERMSGQERAAEERAPGSGGTGLSGVGARAGAGRPKKNGAARSGASATGHLRTAPRPCPLP
jgi:hypothetical protein